MSKTAIRMIVCLCALVLLMTGSALAEDWAMLQVNFVGMYATSSGSYEAVQLAGDFDVQQDGQSIGILHVTPEDNQTMTLRKAANVRLIPVMDTMPEGINVNANGYTVSIVGGKLNVAPLMAYANAGLFRVHTESQAAFALINERSEVVKRFSTDSKGDYVLDRAVPVGLYTLRMEEASLAIAPWRDKVIEIKPYTGPESVLMVDASYYYVAPTMAPTATPRPTATPAPTPVATATPFHTPVITETPVPTQVPTATPAPTATPVPTPVPTPTPEPIHGTLLLQATGDAVLAEYEVISAGVVVADGMVRGGETARIPELLKGSYIVSVHMEPSVILTGLNGYPNLQHELAQWMVNITAGRESLYQIELTAAVGVSGTVNGLEGDALASVVGSYERGDVQVTDGAFRIVGLMPDVYQVAVQLPAGDYTGEGWTFRTSGSQVLAECQAEPVHGTVMTLPAINCVERGSAMGVVTDLDGQPIAGVAVKLLDKDGAEAGSAVTGADGSWSVADVLLGQYTVVYTAAGERMIPAGVVVLESKDVPARTEAREAYSATLKVSVFNDRNNNGSYSPYDRFMSGVRIMAVRRVGSAEAIVAEAVSDKDGNATLEIPAGDYVIRCEMPEGYGFSEAGEGPRLTQNSMTFSTERVQDTALMSFVAGTVTEMGIGGMPTCSATGRIWLDENGDGLRQDKEKGMAGVRVTATGLRNEETYEAFTDETGVFTIGGMRIGTYDVTVYAPEGYVFTIKSNGEASRRSLMTTEAAREDSVRFTLEYGETKDNLNVGFVRTGKIEGVCFLDANYNGVFDQGEKTLAGAKMDLFRTSNKVLLRTEMTDENGYYCFSNIRASNFYVKTVLPVGYTFTVLSDDEDGNQFAPRGGRREQYVYNVEMDNDQAVQVNLGAISYGKVTGTAYYDNDYSGVREASEKVVGSLYVSIYDEKGVKLKTMRTNGNGVYTFDELTPGRYSIGLEAVRGYTFTRLGENNVIERLEGGQGRSALFEVGLGQTVGGMDIGMLKPATVQGRTFADANDNGLYDAGESGLVGTTVRLMQEHGTVDTIVADANGAYQFDNVMPGRYYLRFELPDNGVFSPRVEGGNAVVGEGSEGAGDWFTVTSGDTVTAPVCGGLDLGLISGVAFADHDGSGLMEAGEEAQSGVKLVLTPSRSDLAEMTVVTGKDGAFVFDDLRPDTYTLTVECPDGKVTSRTAALTLGLAHGQQSQKIQLKVGMGNQWTDQKLGCVTPASVSGRAWMDENLDGRLDETERPAAGERVLLKNQLTGETVAEMITDDNGMFTAANVAPGVYMFTSSLGEGYVAPKMGDSTFAEENGEMVMRGVRVNEGEDVSGAALAVVRETKISGSVWLERDGALSSISGAKLTLQSADGQNLASAVSGKQGEYEFKGLMPGQYRVSVIMPDGYCVVEAGDRRLAEEGRVSIVESCDGAQGLSRAIDVRMKDHQEGLDWGAVVPGSLGDFCWLDLNANGLQDGDEGGIPGVKISLMRGGRVVAETTSNQYGYYIFRNIYPGEYTLSVSAPAEVKPTQHRSDLPIIVSVLEENGVSVPVSVVSGKVNYNADLGFVLLNKDKLPKGYGVGETQRWN